MRRILFLLALAFALPASAEPCHIEMALGEVLGPPEEDAFTVSVIPYDARAADQGLRLCYAAAVGKDKLGTSFQAAPANVTCTAADTAWNANERQDFRVSGLSANTDYWYKIQCDQSLPDLWTDRTVYRTRTLATPGADQDFLFTVEADPHYGTQLFAIDGSYCELYGSGRPGGIFDEEPIQFKNLQHGIYRMLLQAPTFHINLGDYWQSDGTSTATCPRSSLHSPARTVAGCDNCVKTFTRWLPGEYWDQQPGWPTRDEAGTTQRSIQTARPQTDVAANAEWLAWKVTDRYQSLYASAPLLLAWGNHDRPYWPAANDAGSCSGYYSDDGAGTPVAPWVHMAEAWHNIQVNPAGDANYYPPQASECETTPASGVPACNLNGQYYTVKAGLAQVWILNAFEESGGAGNPATNIPWDGSGLFPDLPEHWSLGEAQYNWLASTIGSSTAKWKFLAQHNALGGVDVREYAGGAFQAGAGNCTWYARGALLATARYCDVDADGLAGPYDTPDDGGKPCSSDDTLSRGFSEATAIAEGDRSAAWEASHGGCAAGILCLPIPYDGRANILVGHPSYGAPAVQALLAANVTDGGANFIFFGHDHLTAAGCNTDGTGCTEVWYITGGQPVGDGDGIDSPPSFGQVTNATGGQWDWNWDYNGDGIADYRADGSPYPTPVDQDSGTIHQTGTQLRGFHKIAVSDEGVRVDYESVALDVFPAKFGQNVVTYNVGTQATTESDFEGTAAADSESKRSAEAPTVSGTEIDCDYATNPLEGLESCRFDVTVSGVSDAIADALWTDTTELVCADFLFHPESDNEDTGSEAVFAYRNDGANATGQFRSVIDAAGCALLGGDGLGDGCFSVQTAGSGGTVSAASNGYTNGTTYQVRFCYEGGAVDDAEAWIDACNADDDDCDGVHDGTGASVAVPIWGAGTFANLLADGAVAARETDGWRIVARGNTGWVYAFKLDAVGICLGWNPGGFKCGDNFE